MLHLVAMFMLLAIAMQIEPLLQFSPNFIILNLNIYCIQSHMSLYIQNPSCHTPGSHLASNINNLSREQHFLT